MEAYPRAITYGASSLSITSGDTVFAEQVLAQLRLINENVTELAANQRELAAAVKGLQKEAGAPRQTGRRSTLSSTAPASSSPPTSTIPSSPAARNFSDKSRAARLGITVHSVDSTASTEEKELESFDEIPVTATPSTLRGDIQFLGVWNDPNKKFYGGAVIEILEDSWRPVSPPDTRHSHSVFERREISDTIWELIETDQDGSATVYRAMVKGDAIHIHSEDGDTIELRRRMKRSALTEYYGKSNASWRVKSRLWSGGIPFHERVQKLLHYKMFDIVVGLIILVNSVFVGVAIQREYTAPVPAWMEILEHCFLTFYLLELILRVYAAGFNAFRDEWVIFDTILVVIGTTYAWAIQPVLSRAGDDNKAQVLQVVVVFRLARLMRLIRTLRRIPLFNLAWRMAVGLLRCSNTVLSTVALLILLLYTFACIGMEILPKGDFITSSEGLEVVEAYFSTIPLTMLTLVQFVTMDSIAGIYTPLILESEWLCLYFLPIILIVSIMLMNLVTAVIVESALNLAEDDAAEKKRELTKRIRKLKPKLKEFFREIDTRQSGNILRYEMEFLDEKKIPAELKPLLTNKIDHMNELFEFLDADGSGRISQEEFVDGLLNMMIQDSQGVPDETMLLLKLARSSRKSSERLTAKVNQIKNQLSHVQDALVQANLPCDNSTTATAWAMGRKPSHHRSSPSPATRRALPPRQAEGS